MMSPITGRPFNWLAYGNNNFIAQTIQSLFVISRYIFFTREYNSS